MKILSIIFSKKSANSLLKPNNQFYKGIEIASKDKIKFQIDYLHNYSLFISFHNSIFDISIKSIKNLSQIDIFWIKSYAANNIAPFLLYFYALTNSKIFFNTHLKDHLAIKAGKIGQMCICFMNKLPFPDTYYKSKYFVKDYLEITDKLGTNFIFKDNNGKLGKSNYHIKSLEQFSEVLNLESKSQKTFICQKYIENSCDYRVVVVNYNAVLIVKRSRVDLSEHRNNVSVGAKLEFLDPENFEYSNYAEKFAKLENLEICGVDIVVDINTGKPYIIEINSSPGLDILEPDVQMKYVINEILCLEKPINQKQK